MTHCSCSASAPTSSRIEDRASATTVESNIKMKRPKQAPTRVHQGLFRSSTGSMRA